MPLNLVFMGTPGFSVAPLAALIDVGHRIVAVYSQPPRPAGRGMVPRPSPVHEYAAARNLPVLTPTSLRSVDDQSAFVAHGADAAVVVAYGLILPRPVLRAPLHGCFNIHASALPRWRGAAPIQRAIMAGDRETAVMIMAMEEGLDTGPVCATERVAIGDETTAGELHDLLSAAGARQIVSAMAELEAGTLRALAQSAEGVTYAAKIDKSEARIDFRRPAEVVHNLIRGLSPYPGAWFEMAPDGGAPERIKVLRSRLLPGISGTPGEWLADGMSIACQGGALKLLEVQRAGKRPASAEDFRRGFKVAPGRRVVGC
ncbi:MAG: methionyl-tRNA formyltransferase [Hyphomicrobium sp.]